MENNMEEELKPTKENTLSLIIKQTYFDQIVAGTKTCEYRDIKDSTYRKYLECDKEGNPYITEGSMDIDDPLCGDIYAWNNGVYPYIPKDAHMYLHLAVGYHKERDTATVEITDITFEPVLGDDDKPVRMKDDGDGFELCADGDYCMWQIVYHLGNVIEVHRH